MQGPRNLPHIQLFIQCYWETETGEDRTLGRMPATKKMELINYLMCDCISKSFIPQAKIWDKKQRNSANKITQVFLNEAITNFRKNKKVYNKINVTKVNGSEHLQSQNNVKTQYYLNLPRLPSQTSNLHIIFTRRGPILLLS